MADTLTTETLDRLRRDVAELDRLKQIPDPFPGDRTLALLNMQSYLGNFVKPLLAAIDAAESPSPETPGLREAVKRHHEFVVSEWRWVVEMLNGDTTNAEIVEALERKIAAADTPPNREGVVVEGEVLSPRGEGMVPMDTQFALGAAVRQLPPGRVRIEITPLGESGGEQ